MIDRATVQRIKDTAKIVEVVSDYTHLTRRGANYMGLCPFHNERTPSFSVNPTGNFCYCFSCHKGGSPVNFIMEKEGVSYRDALIKLANRYGIKVEERELSPAELEAATEREGLMLAAKRAMEIMEHDLLNTPDGRDIGLTYLYGRGVTAQAIEKFHLGYAMDSWQYLITKMQQEGYDLETLEKLGLAGKSQSGRPYDKYRGRVIFPIMNPAGKVVGFGGRDLSGQNAKYINSPDSVLYHKKLELYGIYQAKNAISLHKRCYLVEGYLDVISMWQSGIQNVVASSGTALTDGQIAIIHRFTENITLLYDGDTPGINAALKGIDLLLRHKMNVSVLLLPDGHDPDSFARAHTAEEFREYIKSHETDIIRFKMQVLMQQAGESPQQRAEVVNSVAHSIACIHDEVQRIMYIGECSRVMKIDEAIIARTVDRERQDILSQEQSERRRLNALHDYPDNSPSTLPAEQPADDSKEQSPQSTDSTQEPAEVSPTVKSLTDSIRNSSVNRLHPLEPLEKEVIKYLVRYGYLHMKVDGISADVPHESDSINPDDNVELLYTLTDFVEDEMNANELIFTNPNYQKIFSLLLEHLDEYLVILQEKRSDIDAEIEKIRKDKLKDIPNRVSTLSDIEREEKRLDDELNRLRNDRLEEFARYYTGIFLASHEEEAIRKIANELLNERHVLSKIYQGNINQDLSIELPKKLNRLMAEWKNEMLAIHSRDLQHELQNLGGDNPEREYEIMMELNKITRARKEIAKQCGERIINAR